MEPYCEPGRILAFTIFNTKISCLASHTKGFWEHEIMSLSGTVSQPRPVGWEQELACSSHIRT